MHMEKASGEVSWTRSTKPTVASKKSTLLSASEAASLLGVAAIPIGSWGIHSGRRLSRYTACQQKTSVASQLPTQQSLVTRAKSIGSFAVISPRIDASQKGSGPSSGNKTPGSWLISQASKSPAWRASSMLKATPRPTASSPRHGSRPTSPVNV